MRFFESIDSFVIQLLDSVSQSMSSNFASSLFTIVGVTLTIYYLGKGFAIMAGKTEAPAASLLYDFATKMIIVAFMMNYGGYLDNSLAIIDDLKTSLTGFSRGCSVRVRLDWNSNIFIRTIYYFYYYNHHIKIINRDSPHFRFLSVI